MGEGPGEGREGVRDVITLTLPWPPQELWPNRSAGRHWSVKAGAAAEAKALALAEARNAKALPHWQDTFRMTWTFHPPSKRRYDLDGALSACKAYQDGLAQGWGVDDSRFKPVLERGVVVRGGRVVVEVEELQGTFLSGPVVSDTGLARENETITREGADEVRGADERQ